jgi:hypothetical protein
MRRRAISAAFLLATALAAAAPEAPPAKEPDLVLVQHILVGFKRSVKGKTLARTKAEAEALAADLLKRARAGEDFDALVKANTDDTYPGVFLLTNAGVPARSGSRPRSAMVFGFGDVSFRLAVGEVGVAAYSARSSPYGWHVIKRLE